MHEHHEELIRSISEEYKDILANSDQAIYIYLDDVHKVCNQKFASLLGYESIEAWTKITDPFPQVFVAEESQEMLVSSYQKAMETMSGSSIEVVWKTKSGTTIKSSVIIVPISHQGHLFALHFVTV